MVLDLESEIELNGMRLNRLEPMLSFFPLQTSHLTTLLDLEVGFRGEEALVG